MQGALPFILSLAAGSPDIAGFLGLGGLFTAHITGNLVVLAARLAAHEPSPLSHAVSVPVFVMILILTRSFVAGLDRIAIPSLSLPLVLQSFLLAALSVSIAAGRQVDPYGPEFTLVGMLAVSGMTVQNALVRVSLAGAPSTAVMTTNASVLDLGKILFGRSQVGRGVARIRVRRTWPEIAGFTLGCMLGAVCERVFGLVALAVPTLISLGAIGFGFRGMERRSNLAGAWSALTSSVADERDAAR